MEILFRLKLMIGLMICLLAPQVQAQYSPAAGKEGSDAVYKTDPRIKSWADNCTVHQGYINISDTTVTYTQNNITSNRAFYGDASDATGQSNGILNCVSLGDGGTAEITFSNPIKNGDGPDFAIFENGMLSQEAPYEYFLELAFVDVSSDGTRYVRFPSVSLTQTATQVDAFGQLDPEKIYNLAGKYVADYGTPFNLDDIKDSTGIDINNITHLRITDVIGSIDPKFASYDSHGNVINDPFPTPFWNCGFDLEAVALMHLVDETLGIHHDEIKFGIFPNPALAGSICKIQLKENFSGNVKISLISLGGASYACLNKDIIAGRTSFDVPSEIKPGLYIVKLETATFSAVQKISIK